MFAWNEDRFLNEADDVAMVYAHLLFCTVQQGIYKSPCDDLTFKCDVYDWSIELLILSNFTKKFKFNNRCTI